jgi:hypothetical protein
MRNTVAHFPTRVCLKSTGPKESRRTRPIIYPKNRSRTGMTRERRENCGGDGSELKCISMNSIMATLRRA